MFPKKINVDGDLLITLVLIICLDDRIDCVWTGKQMGVFDGGVASS